MGVIAKVILSKINKNLRQITKLQQWQSTNDVIKWFNNSYKESIRQYFIQFDVISFYPSISKKTGRRYT